jgi:biopolymer transport protein ExbD
MKQQFRRKSRLKRIESDASLTVTSMMDMFTILLIYLLYFFDPNPTDSVFQLPESSQKQEEIKNKDLFISMEEIQLNGKSLLLLSGGKLPQNADLTPIIEALEKNRSLENSSSMLTIQCDKRIPYASLGPILQAAGQAGYESYRFVVINSPG